MRACGATYIPVNHINFIELSIKAGNIQQRHTRALPNANVDLSLVSWDSLSTSSFACKTCGTQHNNF